MDTSKVRVAMAVHVLASALLIASASSCADGTDSRGAAELAVAIEALTAADVDRVTATISGPGITTPIVEDLHLSGGQWRSNIGGIPSGSDRTFTLIAYDDSPLPIGEVYRGVVTGVTIPRSGLTTVLVVLQESHPAAPFANRRPDIEWVTATPTDAIPGEDVSLGFHITDPDGDALTWQWEGPAGASSFTPPTGMGGSDLIGGSIWHAPTVEGTYRLTLTATDARMASRKLSIVVAVGGRGTAAVRASFNNWPLLTDFHTAQSHVEPGASTTYTGTATDPDSDPLMAVLTDDCGGPAIAGFSGTWTAPAVPGICTLTLTVGDTRGGVTTGTVEVEVGAIPSPNAGPAFLATFQSAPSATSGEMVSFEVEAADPNMDLLTFAWSASTGTLGVATDSATTSSIQWTSAGTRAVVTVTATDPAGGSATAWFVVEAVGTNDRISISPDPAHVDPNLFSTESSIAGNGRYVAFVSGATNLVPDDTNSCDDIFVRDRTLGTTTRVSVGSDGAQGNSTSAGTSISADGRYVAFTSGASNLVPGDTNGGDDVFVRDLQLGATTRVSVQTGGVQAGAGSLHPAISADGRYVTFDSTATDLVGGDTSVRTDVFVHDRLTSTTTRVSVSSSAVESNGVNAYPAISGDGRFVAFYSTASNLVVGDDNGRVDTFVHDRVTGTTERVSLTTAGLQGDQDSYTASLSADGRFVVFHSEASNLVSGDGNGVRDVFLRDRLLGTTERISVDSFEVERPGASFGAGLSPDGRYVAFQTDGAFEVGDTNGVSDVYVRDRVAGTTVRASLGVMGAAPDARSWLPGSGGPFITDDGSLVVFFSEASNLVSVPSDTNGVSDVYVRVLF
ncbi:MAG: PD40 domain-containing protein [Deltaproteobacteria bacterium]|nr:PD40 domain-containing protein [Deltaproteobacteria bacterium]